MKQDYMLHFTWTFFFPCPTELLPREDIIHDNLQYLGNVFGLGFLAGYRVARSKNISSSFIKVAQSIRHRCNIRESVLKYDVRLIYNMKLSYISAVIFFHSNVSNSRWNIPVNIGLGPVSVVRPIYLFDWVRSPKVRSL